MSARTALLLFLAVFGVGIALIVVLPFVFGARPPSADRPAASPSAGGARTEQGVFRSDDGGRTWQPKAWVAGGIGSVADFRVHALSPDPVDPATLYLLTDGSGLWVTKTRGELWVPVQDQAGVLAPSANVLDIAVNPARPAEWYLAVFQSKRGRVLRTADGGRTFQEVYFTPQERFGVFALHYDVGREAIQIATGQGGLLESTDQGRTWRVTRWFADGLIRLMVSPARPALRFVVTSRGNLFRTQDRGETWEDITPSFRAFSGAKREQRWLVDARGTLWLGSRQGLLRSRDGGASFEVTGLIIPPDALPVLAVAVASANPARIMVSAGRELYASEDGGEHWAVRPSPGAGPVRHLAFDAAEADTIYAVVEP